MKQKSKFYILLTLVPYFLQCLGKEAFRIGLFLPKTFKWCNTSWPKWHFSRAEHEHTVNFLIISCQFINKWGASKSAFCTDNFLKVMKDRILDLLKVYESRCWERIWIKMIPKVQKVLGAGLSQLLISGL